jgi:uncharacterized protein (DUF2252 family)
MAASKRAADVLGRIAAHNAGREPERLRMKYAKMASDPFVFFRGSCHLFYGDWPDHDVLDEAPLAWISGDLHLENFGSYRGANRLVYFDITDFDEAALAPASWEVARCATSLLLAAADLRLDRTASERLVRAYLDAYADALTKGKALWVERATATGMVRKLLRGLRKRRRGDFLAARVERARRTATLRIVKGKTLPASPAQKNAVSALFEQLDREDGPASRFFRPLDVARRVAGTGSLGLQRYSVLMEGKGPPDGYWLADLKEAMPSALVPALERRGFRQQSWSGEAKRVVSIQRRCQAVPAALLQAVRFAGTSWILKELQPTEDRLSFKPGRTAPRQLGAAVDTFAQVTAWAQLRGSGREGSAIADALIAFGARRDWREAVLRQARRYAATVRQDWEAFRAAWLAGARPLAGP